MVVKLCTGRPRSQRQFESSVISYGSETIREGLLFPEEFESSVISYGSETKNINQPRKSMFESSVISYGSETFLT